MRDAGAQHPLCFDRPEEPTDATLLLPLGALGLVLAPLRPFRSVSTEKSLHERHGILRGEQRDRCDVGGRHFA